MNPLTEDNQRIVDILTEVFADNRSVNYVVKQGRHRLDHVRHLMRRVFVVVFCEYIVDLPNRSKSGL